MINIGLGWEFHEIEYTMLPSRYVDWGAQVLRKYSFHLKGSKEDVDYIMEPSITHRVITLSLPRF
jgi:hypothetical protein